VNVNPSPLPQQRRERAGGYDLSTIAGKIAGGRSDRSNLKQIVEQIGNGFCVKLLASDAWRRVRGGARQ